MHRQVIFIAVLTVLGSHLFAESAHGIDTSRFFDRKEEGWFWYNEPEPEVETEIPEEPPAPSPPKPAPVYEPAPLPETGPRALSAEWLRENLPRYLDAALDDPTVENVRAYMYLQRLTVDRAEQFADAAELAVMGDPFLDEEARTPTATYGVNQVKGWARQASDEIVSRLSQDIGLFFFYRSDDERSIAQAPIVKRLEERDGFTVLPVSLDGRPLPGGEFPEFRIDEGQAFQLGVSTTPALVMVSSDGHFEPLSQGVMARSSIKNRFIMGAYRAGWISEDEYNRTRPVMNPENNLAAMLELVPMDLGEGDEPGLPESSNFIPPEKLTSAIRDSLNRNNR